MPLAGGFSRGTPISPTHAFQRRSIRGSHFTPYSGMIGAYGSWLESLSLGGCCITLGPPPHKIWHCNRPDCAKPNLQVLMEKIAALETMYKKIMAESRVDREEFKKSANFVSDSFDKIEEMGLLREKSQKFGKEEIKQLSDEMEELIQYHRRDNLEIHWVPELSGENVYSLVCDSAKEAGYNIYIKHHLTARNKVLHKQARDLRSQGYKFVWVRDCNIYVSVNEDARVVHIKGESVIRLLQAELKSSIVAPPSPGISTFGNPRNSYCGEPGVCGPCGVGDLRWALSFRSLVEERPASLQLASAVGVTTFVPAACHGTPTPPPYSSHGQASSSSHLSPYPALLPAASCFCAHSGSQLPLCMT
ncbi:hypothetical protein PR048_023244 [Dryococelus australis]|uniref:FP protein C-terminal domain-containing protein n=1 Tax=Dryococelus australis TaxID=614101 RepID=A0ABQ9GTN7_9NEOP|nr:hypothetical protein PR048_023244 [Dryococelus australis]